MARVFVSTKVTFYPQNSISGIRASKISGRLFKCGHDVVFCRRTTFTYMVICYNIFPMWIWLTSDRSDFLGVAVGLDRGKLVFDGIFDQLGGVAQTQLFKDMGFVRVHCLCADPQLVRNLCIGFARNHKVEYFELAFREVVMVLEFFAYTGCTFAMVKIVKDEVDDRLVEIFITAL